MYLDVTDRKTGKDLGRQFCCHGCGDRTPLLKRRRLPSTWVVRTELVYDDKGIHRYRSGFVENYYCSLCQAYGVTAATVAATVRKLIRLGRLVPTSRAGIKLTDGTKIINTVG